MKDLKDKIIEILEHQIMGVRIEGATSKGKIPTIANVYCEKQSIGDTTNKILDLFEKEKQEIVEEIETSYLEVWNKIKTLNK